MSLSSTYGFKNDTAQMRSSSHIYSKMRVISLVQIENQNALPEISFFLSISHIMISWKELVCLVII